MDTMITTTAAAKHRITQQNNNNNNKKAIVDQNLKAFLVKNNQHRFNTYSSKGRAGQGRAQQNTAGHSSTQQGTAQ